MSEIIAIENIIQGIQTTFPEFKDIRAYGTIKKPMFIAKDLQNMLNLSKLHYTQGYIEGEDYVKLKIQTGGQLREVVAFTEHGLYQLIYRTKSSMGDKFRKFITIILRELRMNKVVTLETALTKLEEEQVKLNEQLEEEHKKAIEYQSLSEKHFHKWQDTLVKSLKIESQYRNQNLWNRGSPEYELQQIKEEFYSKVFIYLEPIPKSLINEIEEYDIDDDVHESDIRLYSISKRARTRSECAIAYVHPKIKLEDIETALEHMKMNYIGKKKLYHVSIEDIVNELSTLKP